jgi:hypothetical protein
MAAPIFAPLVEYYINWLLFLVAVVLGLTAFVHALTQRGDAFAAIGTLPKPAWLAIIGICTLLGFPGLFGTLSVFGLIGIAAALIYLLDVRPGLRDIADGRGMW